MDITIHFNDGIIAIVSQDTGNFIRFVDPQGIAYTIPREKVTSRFRHNKPYYRFIGTEKDIINSPNLTEKDIKSFEILVNDLIYH